MTFHALARRQLVTGQNAGGMVKCFFKKMPQITRRMPEFLRNLLKQSGKVRFKSTARISGAVFRFLPLRRLKQRLHVPAQNAVISGVVRPKVQTPRGISKMKLPVHHRHYRIHIGYHPVWLLPYYIDTEIEKELFFIRTKAIFIVLFMKGIERK
jgi:hypothetical protein